jgi:hypothetical protein
MMAGPVPVHGPLPHVADHICPRLTCRHSRRRCRACWKKPAMPQTDPKTDRFQIQPE